MGYIKIPLAHCVKCNDGVLKPCIGKREKALCAMHYEQEHRRSAKGKKDDLIYARLKKEHIKKYPNCQLNIEGVCIGKAKDIHHPDGRGINFLNSAIFKSACRPCHNFVGDNTQLAYEQGHSGKRLTKKD